MHKETNNLPGAKTDASLCLILRRPYTMCMPLYLIGIICKNKYKYKDNNNNYYNNNNSNNNNFNNSNDVIHVYLQPMHLFFSTLKGNRW